MTARTLTAGGFAAAVQCGASPALRVCTAVTIGASALFLAACASTPTARADTEAVARYRDAGYPVGPDRPIETHRIAGPASEAPWSVSLSRPADGLPHALIIYLPSLGQTDDEPNRWVSAWARAGYAVMVIQALSDDAQVWASDEARSGDFERAARARFQADLMTERLARLSAVLRQIRERSLRGEAGLERIDWSDVAIAGADLGAYEVQSIATAPAQRLAQISWPIAPVAYLAISPYAVRNASASEQPPGGAHVPVLMISARDDIDADGVITDTSLRRLAFDRLGEGDDYYFELASATHRWLGGAVLPPANTEPAQRRPSAPPPPGGERKGKRGAGPATRDAMAPDTEEDDSASEKNARTAAARAEIEKARSRTLTQEALSEVSFACVSTAFLDAYVRRQPTARSWLASSASKWLQNGDRLKHR